MKRLIIIIFLCILIFPAFAQEIPPELPQAKSRVVILETNGIYFLICVDGQKVFAIIHSSAAAIILLPGTCNCEDNKFKTGL